MEASEGKKNSAHYNLQLKGCLMYGLIQIASSKSLNPYNSVW